MQTTSDASPILTERDAAKYLGVSQSYLTVSRLRHNPRTDGPPFVRIGRAVRYLRADLDAFLAARRVTTASTEAA